MTNDRPILVYMVQVSGQQFWSKLFKSLAFSAVIDFLILQTKHDMLLSALKFHISKAFLQTWTLENIRTMGFRVLPFTNKEHSRRFCQMYSQHYNYLWVVQHAEGSAYCKTHDTCLGPCHQELLSSFTSWDLFIHVLFRVCVFCLVFSDDALDTHHQFAHLNPLDNLLLYSHTDSRWLSSILFSYTSHQHNFRRLSTYLPLYPSSVSLYHLLLSLSSCSPLVNVDWST